MPEAGCPKLAGMSKAGDKGMTSYQPKPESAAPEARQALHSFFYSKSFAFRLFFLYNSAWINTSLVVKNGA